MLINSRVKKLRLLIITQYFWPESFIINDIVRKLHEQGHEVVVATGKPNYPEGEYFHGYRFRGTQVEHYHEGIEVIRVPLYARGSGSAKKLIANYLSFVFFGLFAFPYLVRKRKFDAIFVFAPSPLTQVIPAIPLKYIKRVPLVVWVQDLWPESLSATGFVRNKLLLKVMGYLVKGIYFFCDKVLVQSRAFVEPVSRYATRSKIKYYPNSIDTDTVYPVYSLPVELTQILDRFFCVVFAGNLGTAQALDTIVQTALEIRCDPSIRLVLVGSGSQFEWLKEQKIRHNLENLILPGRFPSHAMPQIFKHADALLVTLKSDDIFTLTIPSKVQAYLAAGRPIIACLDGEGARVVLEAEAGFAVPAEQAGALVEAIQCMKALGSDEREMMGSRGRAYFEEHFDMRHQVDSLVNILKQYSEKE